MTSPATRIEVTCPKCGHVYADWFRPSINRGIEKWTDAEVTEASTATCGRCGAVVPLGSIVVEADGTWATPATSEAHD